MVRRVVTWLCRLAGWLVGWLVDERFNFLPRTPAAMISDTMVPSLLVRAHLPTGSSLARKPQRCTLECDPGIEEVFCCWYVRLAPRKA
ncbi:hypothetical protein KC19_9G137100 [Ceratodon purpureus]|uniref:Secreted protein n=1 Tax=Ceratodon purpureus TaxID=3225 RepID=A0A8T0GW09_CERPU|nr:hypothetical protein KC19_9G137100 [Ceratodon purpureus]